ncbi:hypothetical protein [Paenibacillus alvei]|uniref:Uncharacterized protein n=1 Tax=Paenibacillus alvei TaxID=44250 RepID=A0AAP7A038_PAEAL|nr:hypothetical protein [Paenibacillus alvei]NOJ73114.1 hypothetical protein [Paenibacillus alvei]
MDKENKQINTRNKYIFNESTNNETKESFQQNASFTEKILQNKSIFALLCDDDDIRKYRGGELNR